MTPEERQHYKTLSEQAKLVRQVPKIIDHKSGPEDKIQAKFFKRLETRAWLVKRITGNMYQSGLPDGWAAKKGYGQRWIEFKNPDNYSFTPAQRIFFPRMYDAGVGVWIITADDEDNYQRLFQPCNLWHYLERY